jgi:PAS domain S-box-containing protein
MTAAAVVAASGAFLTYDHFDYRRTSSQRLESQGNLLATTSAVTLAFNDDKAAEGILKILSSQTQTLAAAIYRDQPRTIFAKYLRSDAPSDILPQAPGPDGHGISGGHLTYWHPIVDDGKRVGSVYLRSDLRDAWNRLKLNLATLAFILCGVLLVAYLMTERLVKGITGPVAGLVETVRNVSGRRDYSIRAHKEGPAEIEVLIDGVNDMLSQIQVRDGALQLARSELENRVEERTAELRFLNEELSGEIRERRRAEGSLRESEKTMRTLVDFAPDAIVILDVATGRFVDANQNAERLYGYSREELLRLGPVDVSPPAQPDGRPSPEAAFEKVQQAVAGGSPAFEWTHRHASGRLIDCEVHLVRLPVAERALVRGSIMDITRRKEMDRLKDEFVSTVSHELRTPITSIQGSLGLIANGVLGALPAGAKPLVDIAYKNCQRLVLLINDILDSEKIAAGKMKFAFKVQELVPLVEHSVEANRSYAAQFGVRYEFIRNVDAAKVEVDADRLIQVLTNLLSNASKFSPKGESVTISLSRLEGAKLRIAVTDRGPGIPPEFRNRIFQKFSQADSSDTRQKGGTGLGLSISKSIVEKHNGSLFFESEVGKGTTFFVDLPEAAPAVAEALKPAATRRGGVLVCDDDLQVGEYVQALLERASISSDAVQSGERALALLSAGSYDLLILDLLMPDRDGVSVLRELRGRPWGERLPVIVLSGEAGTCRTLEGSPLRPVACLDKPVDPAALLSAVRGAMAPRNRSRVLHVEPDAETRRLVTYTLGSAAETIGVSTLAEARKHLSSQAVDLVILNTSLPDGSGMELMPLLNRAGAARIPAVAFGGLGRPAGTLAGSFLKALGAHDDLPGPIRDLLAAPIVRQPEEALR